MRSVRSVRRISIKCISLFAFRSQFLYFPFCFVALFHYFFSLSFFPFFDLTADAFDYYIGTVVSCYMNCLFSELHGFYYIFSFFYIITGFSPIDVDKIFVFVFNIAAVTDQHIVFMTFENILIKFNRPTKNSSNFPESTDFRNLVSFSKTIFLK